MSSKKNQCIGAGNLGSQKYEALQHMKRFVGAIANAQPSRDTSRWRDPPSTFRYKKQDGKQRLKNIAREVDNEKLCKKIYAIHTDDRRSRTHAYAPGWRIGIGGTVIDCYSLENGAGKNFGALHGREVDGRRAQAKIDRHNASLVDHINKLRSELSPDVLAKAYDKNRAMAKFFFGKNTKTVLHLGLVEAARKRLHSADGSPSGRFRGRSRSRSRSRGKSASRSPSPVSPPWDNSMGDRGRPKSREPLSIYSEAVTLANYTEAVYTPLALPWEVEVAQGRGRDSSRRRGRSVERKGASSVVGSNRPTSASTACQRSRLQPHARDADANANPIVHKARRHDGTTPRVTTSPRDRILHGRESKEKITGGAAEMYVASPKVEDSEGDENGNTRAPSRGKRVDAESRTNVPTEEAPPKSTLSAGTEVAVEEGDGRAAALQWQPRQNILLECSAMAASESGLVPVTLRVSDVGVLCEARLLRPLRQFDHEERPSDLVAVSSGVLVQIYLGSCSGGGARDNSGPEKNCCGQLYLSIQQLRSLSVVTGQRRLEKELLRVHCRDRRAGLFSCLSSAISPIAEQLLCEAVVRSIEVEVNEEDETANVHILPISTLLGLFQQKVSE